MNESIPLWLSLISMLIVTIMTGIRTPYLLFRDIQLSRNDPARDAGHSSPFRDSVGRFGPAVAVTVFKLTNVQTMLHSNFQLYRSRIPWRRTAVFGHIHLVPEQVPTQAALRVAVHARSSRRPDSRRHWRPPRGRPRHTFRPIRQILRSWLATLPMQHGTLSVGRETTLPVTRDKSRDTP